MRDDHFDFPFSAQDKNEAGEGKPTSGPGTGIKHQARGVANRKTGKGRSRQVRGSKAIEFDLFEVANPVETGLKNSSHGLG